MPDLDDAKRERLYELLDNAYEEATEADPDFPKLEEWLREAHSITKEATAQG